MAVTLPRSRRAKNPEGRMSLGAHFAELRRRVVFAALAIGAAAIGSWWLASPAMEHLIIIPVQHATKNGHTVTLTNQGVADAFNIKVKLAVYIGIVISSPVWLYQIWAFVTPGLTRRERRTSMWFLAFAVPLFLSGVALAIYLLPKTISIGADFSFEGTANLLPTTNAVTFATRLIIALGTAFLLPLFLVGLNLMGLMTGRTLGSHWRISVFVAFLFAAIVSPSPDAIQMIILALPLIGLYVVSVFVCLYNDRRRRLRADEDPVFGLPDDVASPVGPARDLPDYDDDPML